MVKHTQTIRRLLADESLRVFEHFTGFGLKGLAMSSSAGIENVMIPLINAYKIMLLPLEKHNGVEFFLFHLYD